MRRFRTFPPSPRKRGGSLRVFGRLPDTDLRECTEAGVRASREETAGEFAPTLVSVYVEFAAAA